MARQATCPTCGAANELAARRCRVCAALLNAAIPEPPSEVGAGPHLPEHVLRRMENQWPEAGGDEGTSIEVFPDGALGPGVGASPPGAVSLPPPPAAADGERFDPDALFRDMARPAPPPVSSPFEPPRPEGTEGTRPPPPSGADPLWAVGAELPPDATSEDIARAAGEALRRERLRRRPGLLDRVFRVEDDDRPS